MALDVEVVGEAIATLLEGELGDALDAIETLRDDGLTLRDPVEFEYSPIPTSKDGAGPYLWVTSGNTTTGDSIGGRKHYTTTHYTIQIAWEYEGDPQNLQKLRDRYGMAVRNVLNTYFDECWAAKSAPFSDDVVDASITEIEAGDPLSKGHEDASVCTIRVGSTT